MSTRSLRARRARRRRITEGIVVALVGGAVFGLQVEAADANANAYCGTATANHCYSTLEAGTSVAFTDIKATITDEVLLHEPSANSGEFISGEFWMPGTNGDWIEAGFIHHYPSGGHDINYGIFWADRKPSCTTNCFFFHLYVDESNPLPTPTTHTFEFIRTSSAHSWNVWDGGVELGTSTVTGMNTATDAQWGSEMYAKTSDSFLTCVAPCTDLGPGSGLWTETALPYKSGTAYNWDTYIHSANSADYHGVQNTTYPWIWSWHKQIDA